MEFTVFCQKEENALHECKELVFSFISFLTLEQKMILNTVVCLDLYKKKKKKPEKA